MLPIPNLANLMAFILLIGGTRFILVDTKYILGIAVLFLASMLRLYGWCNKVVLATTIDKFIMKGG